ncbi:hypothetical protein [Actinopolyspora erythraea]|uniref:hypothetical protein n=1 Tax=Actinopolyspora erythraea TaxID=414996 RepID=UPI000B2F5BF6|nr:hypothetical protein [Actinopolyspora erythraea]
MGPPDDQLCGELADTGIYVGTLSVGASIARSEMSALIAQAEPGTESTGEFPVVDPDDLAEQYWDMYNERDHIERLHPRP